MSNKSKLKGFMTKKKDYTVPAVAIIVGVLAIGAFLYLNSEEPVATVPVLKPRPRPVPKEQVPQESIPTETPTPDTVATVQTPTETPKEAPVFIDNVRKAEEDELAQFKKLIKLQFELPRGMEHVTLNLDDGVAGLEARAPGRKMLILAASRTASPELIAGFLRDQKQQIPMLANYEFKISGEIKKVAGPKSSGISSISIIPGGTNKGNPVFAAYLERSDKKGSYVFVMEASPSQFDQYEGDFDIMTDTLKTVP
jgi:hypothetical protein